MIEHKIRQESNPVNARIPRSVELALFKAISDGAYLNISNFVREAVKDKLLREGFLQISASMEGRNRT